MADNILRVGTEFDVGPLVAGAKVAGTSMQDLAARITASGLTANQTASALQNLGYTQARSVAAANAVTTATQAQINATQVQTTAVQATTAAAAPAVAAQQNLTTTAIAQTAAQNQATTATNQATTATNTYTTSVIESRIATDLLTGNVARAEQALIRFAASSSSLGPILAAAFPVFAAIALVDVVEAITKKIVEATDAIAGWDKATQEAYKHAVDANMALLATNLEQSSQQQKQNQIGLEGIGKQREALADLQADAQRYNQTAMEEERAVRGITEQIKELKAQRLEAAVDPSKFDYATLGKDIDEANRQLTAHLKMRDELTGKLRGLNIEIQGAQKEIAAQGTKDSDAFALAQIEATKKIGEARASQAIESDKGLLATHEITLEQFLDSETRNENDRYSMLQAATEKRIALLQKEASETGKNVKPEITTAQADQAALEIEHQTKLIEINATSIKAITDRTEALARYGEELAHVKEEETIMFEAAGDKAAVEQVKAMADLTKAQDSYATEAAKSAREVAVAQATTRDEQAKQDLKLNEDITKNSQLSALAKVRITTEASNEELNQTRSIEKQKTDIILAELRSQQEAILDGRTLAEFVALQETADHIKELQEWTTLQTQIVVAKENAAKKIIGIDGDILLNNQKVTDEMAKQWAKVEAQIESSVNSNVISILKRHETLKEGLFDVWNGIAENAIKSMLKIAEQEVIGLITKKTMAGQSILIDAKKAGAGAYAATVDIPIIGPILAPIAAATAFAATVAFASFEQGGITESETMARLHPQEMVLPANISKPLQGIIPSIQNFNVAMQGHGILAPAGATAPVAGNSTVHNHMHVEVHNHGGKMDPDTITMAVKKAFRAGRLP